MYLICTSHTTILSMRYRRVNQIIVLANLANYNKRKQFNEPIKIGNVDTVFLNSEMKSAGKKAAGSEFSVCFLSVKKLSWSQRAVQEFLKKSHCVKKEREKKGK